MDTRLISNLIDVSLCLVALFVSVRSFDVYVHFRYQRLFVLGLSMALVSISAAADFTANYVTIITLHTDWFLYIAQTCGFFFIFLSLLKSSNSFLKLIMTLNVLAVPLLLIVLFLSPFLPGVPSGSLQIVLECMRWLISFMIFFAYFFAFTSKATLFNRFMVAAFFLISFGNFMSMMQSFAPNLNAHLLSNLGSITDMAGLIALIIAISWN
jgi:hypothetical protein